MVLQAMNPTITHVLLDLSVILGILGEEMV